MARWNRYLTQPDGVARLGLPAGSAGIAQAAGLGVRVWVQVPAGTVLTDAARAVVGTARQWQWGDYQAAPYDATRFTLLRDLVGEDPATPWRAAGRTAHAVWAGDPPGVRRQLWESAGLAVKRSAGPAAIPAIVATALGDRGPEFLIDLPAGLTADAAVRAAPVLARLFRCPDLAVQVEGVRARIELRTKPPASFPPVVPLEPAAFYRPASRAQRYLAAPHLTLPVGVTAAGEPLMVPLAHRPHTVIAGTSGAGKSRLLLTMIGALCLQGAAVAIGQFKLDPDLTAAAASGMPGLVHYSDTLAGISRLILWLRDELALRSALVPLLARKGITRPVWEPVVVVIDEWGQGLDELLNSADPADRGAAAELVNATSKIFAQGRSFSLHLILSTQHVYSSAIPGRIAQNAATRIVVGRPKAGPRGHIEALFADDKEAGWAAADGIVDGMRGRGIIADQHGVIQQFQAFYGYTPGDDAAAAPTSELAASWERMRIEWAAAPRLRRFAWRFPTSGDGGWQTWSLWPGTAKEPRPTVADLPVVMLDDPSGRPDPAATVFDPLHPAYAPGVAAINSGHAGLDG